MTIATIALRHQLAQNYAEFHLDATLFGLTAERHARIAATAKRILELDRAAIIDEDVDEDVDDGVAVFVCGEKVAL